MCKEHEFYKNNKAPALPPTGNNQGWMGLPDAVAGVTEEAPVTASTTSPSGIALHPASTEANRNREAAMLEKLKLIEKLIAKRDEYVERLDVGAGKIEEARAQGKDVSTWEDYFVQLLHQYEAVADKLRTLQED